MDFVKVRSTVVIQMQNLVSAISVLKKNSALKYDCEEKLECCYREWLLTLMYMQECTDIHNWDHQIKRPTAHLCGYFYISTRELIQ